MFRLSEKEILKQKVFLLLINKMDPVSTVAIIGAISALFVAVCTHVKLSKCWGIEIETKGQCERDRLKAITPPNNTQQTL